MSHRPRVALLALALVALVAMALLSPLRVGSVVGVVAVQAQAAPATPSNLRAGTVNSSSVQALWDANTPTPGYYEIAERTIAETAYSIHQITPPTVSVSRSGLASGTVVYV